MKRIAKSDFQSMYDPMPEDFSARMYRLLASLPAREERFVMKRKMPLAVILTLVLLLLSAGTAAALLNWNAIWALYGQEKPELESLLIPVNQRAEASGVTLEVTSALTDGRTLVLDWTLRTKEDELPVHIQAEELITNGQEHGIQSNGLQVLWLQKGETLHRSYEIFPLDEAVQPGDQIHVELALRVSRPKQEVVVFPDPGDAEEAARLRQQGTWAVAPQCLVFAYRFDENNVLSGFDGSDPDAGLIPAWNTLEADGLPADGFEYDRITLSFDVSVPRCETQPIFPEQTQFALEGCTLEVIEAVRTPLGVYTTSELVSDVPVGEDELPVLRKINAYETHLRLGQGEPTVDYWSLYEIPVWKDEDGFLHKLLQANMIGYQEGLAQDDRTLTLIIGDVVHHVPEDGSQPYGIVRFLHSIPVLMDDAPDPE